MARFSSKLKARLKSDFTRSREGARELYLGALLVPSASALVRELAQLEHSPGQRFGNRASVVTLGLKGLPEMVARRGLRGGIAARVLSQLYFGFRPRAVFELALTAEARARGVPTAQPMGAVVDWVAPFAYRSWYLTRKEPGVTLWEFARSQPPPSGCEQVLEGAREAIVAMYQAGVYHADLNLHNLFVRSGASGPEVIILDLDKARLFDRALGSKQRLRIQARLLRSVRKLDPRGQFFNAQALARLGLQ
jgi:hypothetical protein